MTGGIVAATSRRPDVDEVVSIMAGGGKAAADAVADAAAKMSPSFSAEGVSTWFNELHDVSSSDDEDDSEGGGWDEDHRAGTRC